MPKPTTVLCFDYGLTQIGVAVGSSQLCSAQPLCTLSATDGTPKWEQIETLIKTWKPDRLLVGEPKHMDGSESDMARRALKFARRLEGRFGLPIALIDERLSSQAKCQGTRAFR
jgi:putative holliday junction resolvase